MSINISAKPDYSYLFSSMNQSNSNNLLGSINLSDYNSIKSGTYGKLLKAYYSKDEVSSSGNTDSKNTTAKTEMQKKETTKKQLTEVQTAANDLRDSAAALMQKGSKSVFNGGNMEKVYNAVSDFVDNYNTLLDKVNTSGVKSLVNTTTGIADLAGDYQNALSSMGITVGKDNKLSIDKDTFMKADMNQVKETFNGQNSFAYLSSLRAVSVGNSAYSESNKASLYTGNGNYSNLTTGDIFSAIV